MRSIASPGSTQDTLKYYSSLYKGVSLDKKCGNYWSQITANKRHFLGKYCLAADAAWAFDSCGRKLGLHSDSLNFSCKQDYLKARKKEMKEKAIDNSFSDVQAYMSSKVANAIDTTGDYTPKTEFTSKYKYVYFSKKSQAYNSAILVNKRQHSLGSYQLETDAAWSVDRCSLELGLSFVNFSSESEFIKARKNEIKERRFDIKYSEVEAYMASKVSHVLSKAGIDVGKPKQEQKSITGR